MEPNVVRKADLDAQIANDLDLPVTKVSKITSAFVSGIQDAAIGGEEVVINGLLALRQNLYPARQHVSGIKKTRTFIPERTAPVMNISTTLKKSGTVYH